MFESKVYKTPDIVVADLTEKDIKIIENDSNTLTVEEDVILTGNTDKKKKYNPVKTEDINQWYLKAIGVENTQIPVEKVKVALVDSGVSFSDDIEVTNSINFVDSESEQPNPLFLDESGHGTALAGVICAKNNDKGITGVNPNVELYSAKVLDSNNQAPLSRVIKGIYWAVENNVNIINLSMGTTVNSEALHNAVKEAYNKDILLIASAGNTEHQAVQYPAAYDEVVAVGSTDTKGELAELSSTGTELELLAPGEKIATNGFLGFTTVTSGTSIATAQVTGVASLLLQKDTSKSSDFIRKLLKISAKTVEYDVGKSAGLIDFEYANSIYNDFSAKYLQGLFDVNEYENTSKPQDYSNDTDSIAEGLWSHSRSNNNKGHYATAVDVTDGWVDDQKLMNTIIDAACWADDKYSNGTKVSKELHGSGNYIAKLKYLYFLNYYLTIGKSYTNSNDLALSKLNLSGDDNTKLQNLANEVDIACNSYGENNRIVKRGKVIGFALHLIGDIFAHRTIIPTYTVEGANPYELEQGTKYEDKLGTYDFDRSDINVNTTSVVNDLKDIVKRSSQMTLAEKTKYKNFESCQKAINKQILEFRDIKYFQKFENGSIYEDNADFCRERYNQSFEICEQYIVDVMYNYQNYLDENDKPYFDLQVMRITREKLKLNNLRNYYIQAGESDWLDMYSTSGWEKHSTNTFV